MAGSFEAERSDRRAAVCGEALGDDLAAIAGTSLDKGVEPDALAKMEKPTPSRRRSRARIKKTGGVDGKIKNEVSHQGQMDDCGDR